MRVPVQKLGGLWLALLLVASSGCDQEPDFRYEGTGATPTAVTFAADVPLVRVAVNEQPERLFLLDTGAPITLLDPDAFDPPFSLGRLTLDRLALLGVTVRDHDVGADALFGDGFSAAGVVGGDILAHFAVTLDYQGGRAALWPALDGAPPPMAADTAGPPASVPFSLSGGGAVRLPGGDTLTVGATRVLLWLSVEGLPALGVVDTGASLCVLDESLYQSLLEARPDRPRLRGLPVATLQGMVAAEVSRLAALALLDAPPAADSPDASAAVLPESELSSVPVLILPDTEALDLLSEEVGRPVDLLVGASYLRAFQVTVDYPARVVTLERYRTLSHVDPDEWVGVGFTWTRETGAPVQVEAVLPGTDAEAVGVLPGDAIWRAGSHDVRAEGPAGVQAALDASDLGDRVPFQLGRNGSPVDLSVEIEDLLPRFDE